MRIIGKLCQADICQLSLSSKMIDRGKLDEEDVREKNMNYSSVLDPDSALFRKILYEF